MRGSQEVKTIRIRQPQIDEQEVDRLRRQEIKCLAAIRRRVHGRAIAEGRTKKAADCRLIVRNEYTAFSASLPGPQ